jgi:hypothetical protein
MSKYESIPIGRRYGEGIVAAGVAPNPVPTGWIPSDEAIREGVARVAQAAVETHDAILRAVRARSADEEG